MTNKLTEQEAAAMLRGANRILLLAHQYPDGDTLGSNFALCQALQSLGKTVRVLCGRNTATGWICVSIITAPTPAMPPTPVWTPPVRRRR